VIGEEFDGVLAAARAGDEWAVEVLWRDLHPPLLRYLRAMDPGVAEDVESETWFRAARKLGGFEGNEVAFLAWMFTIARHCLIDWRRQASRRPSVPVDPGDLPEHPALEDTVTLAVENLETEAAVALVRTLPVEQAEVILLRVLSGLDIERVAAIVGKRPGAVRALQHRGLRRLAQRLAEPKSQPEIRSQTWPETGGITQ
jgi:RNA polymerase sigma-70 factor (ECF subfamily)